MNFVKFFYSHYGVLLFITFAIAGTILNTTVISLYCKRPQIRNNIANILLTNQAAIDLFNSLFYCLVKTLRLHFNCQCYGRGSGAMGRLNLTSPCMPPCDKFRMANKVIVDVSMYSSLLGFAISGLDRLAAVWWPLPHRAKVTKGFILRAILIAWGVSFILLSDENVSSK